MTVQENASFYWFRETQGWAGIMFPSLVKVPLQVISNSLRRWGEKKKPRKTNGSSATFGINKLQEHWFSRNVTAESFAPKLLSVAFLLGLAEKLWRKSLVSEGKSILLMLGQHVGGHLKKVKRGPRPDEPPTRLEQWTKGRKFIWRIGLHLFWNIRSRMILQILWTPTAY